MGSFINRRPASNFHHAIRIATAIKQPLNVFVSVNFSHTTCPPQRAANAFQLLRRKFGKWITRPSVKSKRASVPATFVWVLENPSTGGNLHSHWLLHVPSNLHAELKKKLPLWLEKVVGSVTDTEAAIDVRRATTPRAAGRYMLKGMHPMMAAYFDIRHEDQGWIDGRRSGFTKNLGPVQKRRLRALDQYPKSRHWVSFSAPH
jgi:hypothetical protein